VIWKNVNRTRPEHACVKSVSREGDQLVVEVSSEEYDFELDTTGA